MPLFLNCSFRYRLFFVGHMIVVFTLPSAIGCSSLSWFHDRLNRFTCYGLVFISCTAVLAVPSIMSCFLFYSLLLLWCFFNIRGLFPFNHIVVVLSIVDCSFLFTFFFLCCSQSCSLYYCFCGFRDSRKGTAISVMTVFDKSFVWTLLFFKELFTLLHFKMLHCFWTYNIVVVWAVGLLICCGLIYGLSFCVSLEFYNFFSDFSVPSELFTLLWFKLFLD